MLPPLVSSLLLLGALTPLPLLGAAAPVAAAVPCAPGGNEIVCENSKPGTPSSEWDVDGAGDDAIQGFATDISVDRGSTIDFKIDTTAADYDITIYRTGWYDGDGAREVDTVEPSATLPQLQPECITDVATELVDCGNWGVSASWDVPADAVSGVYLAKLEIPTTGWASHITFVVRDDDSDSGIVFQTSDPTWQAYNTYGGSDFYQGGAHGRAYKVSYNRPVLTRDGPGGRDFYFANEYPLVRFLERNGYDVSYLAGVDTDRHGDLLLNHDVFLSVGHDEYWSGAQRAHVEAARDAGVHLQFLSGNEVYWRTRYEPSADASHTGYRTLVSYKETWSYGDIDPADEWTGTWRDPRYNAPAQGAGVPENSLTGTMYMVNHDDHAVTVTRDEGRLRLWRGTGLGSMPGASTELAPHTVGYESDEDVDNGFRPPGLIRLSTMTGPTTEYLQDFGNVVAPGTTTHHLTMYRAPSGALVFGAGSVQWTWGLDDTHDSPFAYAPADPRMQQAQVNLFADMGEQPATLQPDLTAATASTDTTGPSVAVTTPGAGDTVANGAVTTISGTATDTGGGRVAGVEVSLDGGTSWSAADGTTSWSYSYVQRGPGLPAVRVRAMDDSANIGATETRSLVVTCPCSVFGEQDPEGRTSSDTSDVELGLRFTARSDGFVSGVRFYQAVAGTGAHTGTVWSSDGEALANVSFPATDAIGWRSATFATAVPVLAGEQLVVSYSAPQGRYVAETDGFSVRGVDAGPLSVAGGFGATPAGVYALTPGTFPTTSYRNTNYYADALFTTSDESPLVVLGRSPLPDAGSIALDTTVSARFSRDVVPATVRLDLVDAVGSPVAGALDYAPGTRTVTFTPAQPLNGLVRHTATVTASDASGRTVSAGGTWSFTTARPPSQPGVCPCTLFDESLTPTVADSGETLPVVLGTRFAATTDGVVTGVRFYRGPNNSGPWTGTLWSAGGVELASGTISNQAATGWQTIPFTTPRAISAGVDYVVSYRSPTGHFSVTPGAFSAQDLSRPPLRVTSTSGSYRYGTGFPSNRTSSNYLVDPIFERAPASISVTERVPADGALDVPRGTVVSATFSSAVEAGAQLEATVGGQPVAGSTVLSGGGTVLTLDPTDRLPLDTLVQVELSGVVASNGAVLPTTTWSFRTTAAPDPVGAQTLMGDEVPVVAAVAESSPVELGTAFVAGTSGRVTAIRFFKGTGNNGTHTGSLWSTGGTRLATVTFAGETASGWQTAQLAQPLQVQAGQTYVVSYFAPQGHYSYTSGYFTGGRISGDLTAPATQNGRYLYGSGGAVPTYSWNATSYFVDVVFVPDGPTVSVVSRSPAPAADDVPVDTVVSVRFSAPVVAGTALSLFSGGVEVPATTTRSGDGQTLTLDPTAALPADTSLEVRATAIATAAGATLPDDSWTFRTAGSATSTLLGDLAPQTPAVADGAAVELGTVFSPTVDGRVTHVRFYKGPGNTGTHTGSVWSAAGTRLATVTFTNETATGWQSAQLATPLAVTAGTTYVVSYFAPVGRYSATSGFFSGGWTSGALTAPATANGRYRYGPSGFPTSTWNATSYSVDVVFRSGAP